MKDVMFFFFVGKRNCLSWAWVNSSSSKSLCRAKRKSYFGSKCCTCPLCCVLSKISQRVVPGANDVMCLLRLFGGVLVDLVDGIVCC